MHSSILVVSDKTWLEDVIGGITFKVFRASGQLREAIAEITIALAAGEIVLLQQYCDGALEGGPVSATDVIAGIDFERILKTASRLTKGQVRTVEELMHCLIIFRGPYDQPSVLGGFREAILNLTNVTPEEVETARHRGWELLLPADHPFQLIHQIANEILAPQPS